MRFVNLVSKHHHHCNYYNNNSKNIYFLLAVQCYSPQAGPLVQMQHNVCRQGCSSTVISEPPPAAGNVVVSENCRQTEGTGSVELVLNSNSCTDSFCTLQLCSLGTAE